MEEVMKRVFAVVLVLIMCLAVMTGCGKKDEPIEPGMPNPVTSYGDAAEQALAVGFGLEAPEGASDVSYQSIESMAETVFTLNGVKYSYRAEATDKLEAYDMSGLFYEMEESAGSVQDRDAVVMLCEEAGFVMWLDVVPGINYNLSAVGAVDADTLLSVANSVFASVQGEAG